MPIVGVAALMPHDQSHVYTPILPENGQFAFQGEEFCFEEEEEAAVCCLRGGSGGEEEEEGKCECDRGQSRGGENCSVCGVV